jgi:hypothetical protein
VTVTTITTSVSYQTSFPFLAPTLGLIGVLVVACIALAIAKKLFK